MRSKIKAKAKPKAPKAEKLAEWKPVASPTAAYTEAMRTFVHYSARTVNSSVATGVRVALADFYDAPFLAVSTLLQDSIRKDRVPVDYIRNANPDSTLLKQIDAARDPTRRARFTSVLLTEEAIIKGALPLLDEAGEYETQFIDARLRQVLLPTSESIADDKYVALTPLSAAGLSALAASRLAAAREQQTAPAKNTRYQNYAALGHGGASAQNVGLWAIAMNKALVFNAPAEEPAMRKAYAIFYKGLQLSAALVPQLNDYVYWHLEQVAKSNGVFAENLKTKVRRSLLLTAIAKRALAIGKEAESHQILMFSQDESIEHIELTHDAVVSIERQMIDPRRRNNSFNERFAQWIMRLVQLHAFKAPGTQNKVYLGMSDAEAGRLAGIIKGAW